MMLARDCWIDGTFLNVTDARTHICCHAIHYGTTAFDGMRFYPVENSTQIFRSHDHLERFLRSVRSLGFHPRFSLDALVDAARETVERSKFTAGYLRVIAFADSQELDLSLSSSQCTTAIFVWSWPPPLGPRSVTLWLSSIRRPDPRTVDMETKISGNYANNVRARIEARNGGFDDALMMDLKGDLAETSGANFFAIRDGILVTPPRGSIFLGITRGVVIELAQQLGIKVCEASINPTELGDFQEFWLTGTAVELVAVASISPNGIETKESQVFARFRRAFDELVRTRAGSPNPIASADDTRGAFE